MIQLFVVVFGENTSCLVEARKRNDGSGECVSTNIAAGVFNQQQQNRWQKYFHGKYFTFEIYFFFFFSVWIDVTSAQPYCFLNSTTTLLLFSFSFPLTVCSPNNNVD